MRGVGNDGARRGCGGADGLGWIEGLYCTIYCFFGGNRALLGAGTAFGWGFCSI